MKENIVKQKSLEFAIRIVRLCQFLNKEKREYILAKQLLRSGTSVGAMIREAEYAESRADFIHKLSISQKEINESLYWMELMSETGYLSAQQHVSMSVDAVEILKLLTSIIKKTKINSC